MKKNSFLEGAFIATLAIFITKFLGIIYVIPFNKIIGNTGGALYGYAYNIYNLFLIISCSGLPLAISKLTSEYNTLKEDSKKEYLFYIATKIIGIFSIVSFLICFLFSKFIATLIIGNMTGGNTIDDVSFVIKCVSFAILIVPMLSISRGYMQGHRYMSAPAISQIIEQVARIIVLLLGSYTILKLFPGHLTEAVGISVFAAFVGAVLAYIYLNIKLKVIRNKDIEINLEDTEKKEVTKKLIKYAIPFIVINIANSLYTTVDMILVIKGLNILGFKAVDIETISGIFTTWGIKINTIITSFATGIALSLIPNISREKARNDLKEVNNKFNKTIILFFYIILPLSIFMSIFGSTIWNIFYGYNEYGIQIIKYSLLVAGIDALYIMISNALQGMNKTKLIYTSVLTGLITNAILDIPLMLLFNKLNIYPYYGAITATLIGYLISIIIPLVSLKKKDDFNYDDIKKILPKLLGTYTILIIICICYNYLIKNITNRIIDIFLLMFIGIICLVIYYLFNKKEINAIIKKDKKDTGDIDD